MQIEELGRKPLVVNIFPAIAANHPGASGARRHTQREPRPIKRVIDFAERTFAPGTSLAAQPRHQRAPFQPLTGICDPHPVENRGHDIDRLDQPRVNRAATDIGRRIRVTDDERNTRTRVVKELLLAQPMVAEIVTMITGEDDGSVLEPAIRLKLAQQPANVIVELLDQAHVGRHRHRALFIIRVGT